VTERNGSRRKTGRPSGLRQHKARPSPPGTESALDGEVAAAETELPALPHVVPGNNAIIEHALRSVESIIEKSDKSAQAKGLLSIAGPFDEGITVLDDAATVDATAAKRARDGCQRLYPPSRAESLISRSF
jgi:hypothetical protein